MEEAQAIYDAFADWAKRMSVRTLVVSDGSDVPRERIGDRFGRIYQRVEQYVRL
jgi:hypothetical protein